MTTLYKWSLTVAISNFRTYPSRMTLQKQQQFPSRIFCLWNMFVQFKFPFVGREKTCFNFYVYIHAHFSAESFVLCSQSEGTHACRQNKHAIVLYMQHTTGCLFAHIKHVSTGDAHSVCYVKLHCFNSLDTLNCIIELSQERMNISYRRNSAQPVGK